MLSHRLRHRVSYHTCRCFIDLNSGTEVHDFDDLETAMRCYAVHKIKGTLCFGVHHEKRHITYRIGKEDEEWIIRLLTRRDPTPKSVSSKRGRKKRKKKSRKKRK